MPNELGDRYPKGYQHLALTEMLLKDILDEVTEFWDEVLLACDFTTHAAGKCAVPADSSSQRFETLDPSKEHLDVRNRTTQRSFVRRVNENLYETIKEQIAQDIKAEEEGRDSLQEEAEGKAEGEKNTLKLSGPYRSLLERVRDRVEKELEEEKAKRNEDKTDGGKK
ncbi:MAG: hypothetical protein Q9213_002245 [Squamulea squamosa]